MSGHRAIGGHHSAAAGTVTWLTPPPIILALGGPESFDLDPCAAPAPRPWPTARHMNAEADGDGLALEWDGRVWLNPPYSSADIENWLRRLADHGCGTALVFARTETAAFERQIWSRASGLMFLHGRLHFHYPNGRRAKANAGAPSVLAAYGQDDMDRLAASAISGAFVPLRFARFVMVGALAGTWGDIIGDWIRSQRGPVSVLDAYRHFSRHPKAANNRHVRETLRKQLAIVARRVAPGQFEAAA